MPAVKHAQNHSQSYPLVFLAAIGIAAVLAYPFITPLTLALITAYALRPMVRRLEAYTRSYSLALGILVVLIGLPIVYAVSYVSANVARFFADIAGFGDEVKMLITGFSEFVASMGFGAYVDYFLSAQNITAHITSYAVGVASDLARSVPILLLDVVVYLYATYYFMRHGSEIVRHIRAYASTLPREDQHFISSILLGVKKGFDVLFLSYITMSVIIAITSFIIYSVFGAPHAFLLALLTGLFAFLPVLGVWMVYGPLAIYLYTAGNVFAAAGILISSALILSLFYPFILQPYLGWKSSNVNPLAIVLGFLSGPMIFSAKGLLLGPILFVVAYTVIREYVFYRVRRR